MRTARLLTVSHSAHGEVCPTPWVQIPLEADPTDVDSTGGRSPPECPWMQTLLPLDADKLMQTWFAGSNKVMLRNQWHIGVRASSYYRPQGKVMFSEECVILSMRGGACMVSLTVWYHVPSRRRGLVSGEVGTHCSNQYISYWNVSCLKVPCDRFTMYTHFYAIEMF